MKMATIGLNEEQAKAVADMLSAVEQATAAVSEQSKEKARARWRKWKEANGDKRLQTTANVSKPLVRAHSETKPKDTDNSKKQTPSDVEAFKAAFAGVCDAGRVEAIIKHRRTKRSQVTGHSAALFIADSKAAGLSIPDAIDTCISRNWITVKADWLAPNQRGFPKPKTAIDVAEDLLREMETTNANATTQIEGYSAPPLRLSDYRHG